MTRESFHPDDPSLGPLVGALIIAVAAVVTVVGLVNFFAWLLGWE